MPTTKTITSVPSLTIAGSFKIEGTPKTKSQKTNNFLTK
jgi:hypothetical protein